MSKKHHSAPIKHTSTGQAFNMKSELKSLQAQYADYQAHVRKVLKLVCQVAEVGAASPSIVDKQQALEGIINLTK